MTSFKSSAKITSSLQKLKTKTSNEIMKSQVVNIDFVKESNKMKSKLKTNQTNLWALSLIPFNLLTKILKLLLNFFTYSTALNFLTCVVLYRVPFSGVPDPTGSVFANLGLLGLNPFITKAEIKKAYHTVHKNYNPLLAKDPKTKKLYNKILQKANIAYEILSHTRGNLIPELWVAENLMFIDHIEGRYKEIQDRKDENLFYWNFLKGEDNSGMYYDRRVHFLEKARSGIKQIPVKNPVIIETPPRPKSKSKSKIEKQKSIMELKWDLEARKKFL
jgi:hypothetical protein